MSTAARASDCSDDATDEAVDHDVSGRAGVLPVEEERVMDLLHEHVPLALLCDLVDPDHALDSTGILAAEGAPDDHWWEPPTHNID